MKDVRLTLCLHNGDAFVNAVLFLGLIHLRVRNSPSAELVNLSSVRKSVKLKIRLMIDVAGMKPW